MACRKLGLVVQDAKFQQAWIYIHGRILSRFQIDSHKFRKCLIFPSTTTYVRILDVFFYSFFLKNALQQFLFLAFFLLNSIWIKTSCFLYSTSSNSSRLRTLVQFYLLSTTIVPLKVLMFQLWYNLLNRKKKKKKKKEEEKSCQKANNNWLKKGGEKNVKNGTRPRSVLDLVSMNWIEMLSFQEMFVLPWFFLPEREGLILLVIRVHARWSV